MPVTLPRRRAAPQYYGGLFKTADARMRPFMMYALLMGPAALQAITKIPGLGVGGMAGALIAGAAHGAFQNAARRMAASPEQGHMSICRKQAAVYAFSICASLYWHAPAAAPPAPTVPARPQLAHHHG